MQQDFIPNSQFGFLPGRSVTMALACAQTDWIEAKSRGDTIGVLGFDLSAAFDTVSSSKLLAKLESTGISGTPLKWFSSYMNNRLQRVLWNDSLSKPRSLTYGVPQGSILGPTLFLVMIADMPKHVICDVLNAKMTGYADDSAIYVWANNVIQLKTDIEKVSNCMISYCRSAGLILNNDKTQFLVSPKQQCHFTLGSTLISASSEMNLLGVNFDSNFSTTPYLHKLAREAKTRSKLITRLSFSMPPYVLTTFANGLLMGKILSACPVTIPIRLNMDDNTCISITEEINKAIKATARCITRTKLSDKVCSEDTLHKAGLKCLNEAVASILAVTVWKSKQSMNMLGQCLFKERLTSFRTTRSMLSGKIQQPVPGYPTLATNIMARVWNDIPDLHNATSLNAAKSVSQKWAKSIPR